MAKATKTKSSLIGAVGGILIGAALLLFIATIILNALKETGGSDPGLADADSVSKRADWNDTNDTVEQLKSFLTIGVVLLGVLGITMIGASIIGYISGAFA